MEIFEPQVREKDNVTSDLGEERGLLASSEGEYVEKEGTSRHRQEDNDSMTVEELYSFQGTETNVLKRALKLLKEAEGYADRAVEAFESEDVVGANDTMLHLRPLLLRLFEHREIGDGFGAVVNALLQGLRNMGSDPFTLQHARAARWVLRDLRESPKIEFVKSLELVDVLENAGFRVEAKGIELIAGLFQPDE